MSDRDSNPDPQGLESDAGLRQLPLASLRRRSNDQIAGGDGQPEARLRGALGRTLRNRGLRVFTLESADRPYQVLIEQIQEGAVTLGPGGTVLYCNRRVADMLAMPQERIIGQSLRRLVLAEDMVVFTRLLASARQIAERTELALRPPNGSLLPVYLSLSPLRGEDGTTLPAGFGEAPRAEVGETVLVARAYQAVRNGNAGDPHQSDH